MQKIRERIKIACDTFQNEEIKENNTDTLRDFLHDIRFVDEV